MTEPALTPSSPSTVDAAEIRKFSEIAAEWWDEKGKFRPLHQLNPARIGYIRDQATAHFGLASESEKPLKDKKLLDIGCGGGLLSEPMCRLGAHVTGADAAARNIEVAKLHAAQMGLTIDYRATTAEALVDRGETFDIVLALEIVEHVSDVSAFLAALTHLVVPGGMLVMSTLNRTVKSLLMAKIGAEYILRWLPVGTHDWDRFLKPSELTLPLEHHGFMLRNMSGIIFSPFKQEWRIDPKDIDVNYIATFVRSN